MPPKYKSRKRVADADEYNSDGGFVEDAPKSKRAKSSQTVVSQDLHKDDDGNEFWELSGKRRVTLSSFKNMQLISIREYYEKDGKMLPGKKGISLSLEQYSAFLGLVPQIEDALKGKGETVSRPSYSITGSTAAILPPPATDNAVEDDKELEEEVEDEPAEDQRASSKLDKFKFTKKNHEATSDEED